MQMTKTALGGWAATWQQHHAATILRILWDVRQLGGLRAEARVAQFANATGLDVPEVLALCQDLAAQGLIRPGLGRHSYVLTTQGFHHVRNLLGPANEHW